MALDSFVINLDSVAEVNREHYVALDANDSSKGFSLGLNNAPKGTIAEFRDTNIALMKERDGFQQSNAQMLEDAKKFKNIDPVLYAKYQEQAAKVESEEERLKIQAGGFEEVFLTRTQKMKDAMAAERESWVKEKEGFVTKLEGLEGFKTRSQVEAEFDKSIGRTKLKLIGGTKEDVMRKVHDTWKVVDGNMVAHDLDNQPIYGDDSKPLTMDQYNMDLAKKAHWFFEGSSGGGAKGTTAGTMINGKRVLVNPTNDEMVKYCKEIASKEIIVRLDR